MTDKNYCLTKHILYLLKARHRKGFSIHSPYVFRLLNTVFFENSHFYCYEQLDNLNHTLQFNEYKNKQIACQRLLFRLALHNRSAVLLDCAENSDMRPFYLAATDKQNQVFSFVTNNEIKKLHTAIETFGYDNIKLETNGLDTVSQTVQKLHHVDFAVFDPSYYTNLEIMACCLSKTTPNTIFALHGIYRNCSNAKIWESLKAREDVALSIDIYHMGFLFFNTELPKQDYTVAF